MNYVVQVNTYGDDLCVLCKHPRREHTGLGCPAGSGNRGSGELGLPLDCSARLASAGRLLRLPGLEPAV